MVGRSERDRAAALGPRRRSAESACPGRSAPRRAREAVGVYLKAGILSESSTQTSISGSHFTFRSSEMPEAYGR